MSSRRVHLAIARTPREYLITTLRQRLVQDEMRAGSFYTSAIAMTAPELLGVLLLNKWQPYEHAALKGQDAALFRAEIPGYIGVVHIDQIDEARTPTIAIRNPKNRPHCQAVVYERGGQAAYPAPTTSFSVAILGPGTDLDEEDEILWTVHPGDPVEPTKIPLELYRYQLTISEARALGIEWVKVAT